MEPSCNTSEGDLPFIDLPIIDIVKLKGQSGDVEKTKETQKLIDAFTEVSNKWCDTRSMDSHKAFVNLAYKPHIKKRHNYAFQIHVLAAFFVPCEESALFSAEAHSSSYRLCVPNDTISPRAESKTVVSGVLRDLSARDSWAV